MFRSFAGKVDCLGKNRLELEFTAHLGYAHEKFEPAQTHDDETPLG